MLIYKFYKFYRENIADAKSIVKCDISGEEFKQLIRICCKFSTVLSLNYYGKDAPMREKLKRFESLVGPPAISFVEYHNHGGKCIYYDVCEELCDIIIDSANSIFDDWIPNWQYYGPDNLTFYREDGTVFMNTVTHDNIVILRPRENEDISKIILNKYWLSHNNDWHERKASFYMDCVPNEKTATAIAKLIFKNTKFPNKKDLKWLETNFDVQSNKWIVIFARRDISYSICKILIDKETSCTEIFYETI